MTKKRTKLSINKERCKGCLLCIEACPAGAITISDDVNSKGMKYIVLKKEEKCTGCGMCFMMCPDLAIEIKFKEEE